MSHTYRIAERPKDWRCVRCQKVRPLRDWYHGSQFWIDPCMDCSEEMKGKMLERLHRDTNRRTEVPS